MQAGLNDLSSATKTSTVPDPTSPILLLNLTVNLNTRTIRSRTLFSLFFPTYFIESWDYWEYLIGNSNNTNRNFVRLDPKDS